MHTNEEWAQIIRDVAKSLDNVHPQPAIDVKSLDAKTLAKTIDHTLLKLDATEEQITQLCREAVEYDFAAVCVRANHVAHAKSQLEPSNKDIKIACVIGFHEGDHPTSSKLHEIQTALTSGATELDIVLNRTLLPDLSGTYTELLALRAAAPAPATVLKLILETSQLSEEQVVQASVLAGYAGFDFIKTSTGFCGRGASARDVVVMSGVAEVLREKGIGVGRMRVKASGGVRTLGGVREMVGCGAVRIGTSGGVGIMREFLEGVGGEGGEGY